jgi:hypothetical protein
MLSSWGILDGARRACFAALKWKTPFGDARPVRKNAAQIFRGRFLKARRRAEGVFV